MKLIPLTQGQHAIVDDEDYDFLMQWKWHCTSDGYAARSVYQDSKRQKILMHRIILDAPEVDHQDTNRLNNQRSNLRSANRSQNVQNARKRSGGSSIYKGVSWCKRNKKWAAQLHSKAAGNRHLGYFDNEIEAAKSYDTAARSHYGEYARTNF